MVSHMISKNISMFSQHKADFCQFYLQVCFLKDVWTSWIFPREYGRDQDEWSQTWISKCLIYWGYPPPTNSEIIIPSFLWRAPYKPSLSTVSGPGIPPIYIYIYVHSIGPQNYCTQMLNIWYIYLLIYHKSQANETEYTSPMDPMGCIFT